MKKLIVILLMTISTLLFAGHGWERVNHMQSTIFTAHVNLNGEKILPENMIGAFVGKECRMISPIIINNDSSFVSSVIHGDVAEEVSFKLWLAEKDTIIQSTQTVTSKPGGSILYYDINFVIK